MRCDDLLQHQRYHSDDFGLTALRDWKPLFVPFTNLLEFSIERGLGALQGLRERALNSCVLKKQIPKERALCMEPCRQGVEVLHLFRPNVPDPGG